ncbi:MAG: pilus assembly protein PilP [Desulfuromonadia bacterium]
MKRRRQINRFPLFCLSILLTLGITWGCGKKEESPPPPPPQPKKPVQKPQSTARALQQPLSSTRKPPVEQIDFSKRRDPFKPVIASVTPSAGSPEKKDRENPNLLPIQRYEVDRFRVTGIIAGLKENRAMIVDPEGKGYVAKVGMKIGPNDGRIVRITPQTVDVEESFRDDFGRLKKRTVRLALQRKR